MSEKEESAAQKAARLRRERREAKIKAGGTERLQRITGLTGRPANFDASHSPSPSARSSPAPSTPTTDQPSHRPQAQAPSVSPLPLTPNLEDQSPENIKAQEEYLRALLRSQTALNPGQAQGQNQSQPQDPTAKLLSAFLGGNQDGVPAIPGLGAGGAGGENGMPEFSPSDLTSALGIPGPLASFFSRQTKPETPGEQRRNSIFKIVHLVFALVMGWYLLSSISGAVVTYGPDPPPPSTAQSPFVVFMTVEVVLAGIRVGGRVMDGQGRDAKMWLKVLGDVARDGKIVVFLLGMWSLFSESGTARQGNGL